MIVPDVNILVYAHNRGVPEHEAARRWWETTVNGAEPVGIDWAVALGFVRLTSNPRVAARPQPPEALCIELSATLATNDTDFTRFAGLRTVNPLDP